MSVTAALALALLLHPGGHAPPQATTQAATQPAAAAPKAPAKRVTDTGLTGILTEEAFKALHQLRTDAPPAPQGKTIDLAGGKAYLSLPAGSAAPMPGVIVIQEWWGLNDNIRHWTDRLAADGYAALAVDLYDGTLATTPDAAMAAMKGVKDERAAAILAAAHAFLKDDPRVKAPRTATIGWCFGGGWSLKTALAEQDLDACVIYYGRLETDPEALRAIRASVLGVFGTQDEGIPQDTVTAFEAALGKAGVERRILRYEANHAFANPSSARYDEPSATAAWGEVRAFLAAKLKPGAGR